jgi:hypothetical protein
VLLNTFLSLRYYTRAISARLEVPIDKVIKIGFC